MTIIEQFEKIFDRLPSDRQQQVADFVEFLVEQEAKSTRGSGDGDRFKGIDLQRSRIGLAVAGDPNYGNDSPLYGAMGFVRKSEKKSGLTRKKKPTTP